MASDDSTKFLVALVLISLVVLGLVSLAGGPNSSGILTSIFGGTTYLNGGSTSGSSIASNGTILNGQSVIVPASLIEFKTRIQADYADGSNEIIYQQSNLPGLSVISVHGKPLTDISALTVIALPFLKPAPAGTTVTFTMNYTDNIESQGAGWWYRQIIVPLAANNSLAMVSFPPVVVKPTDVFPDASSLTSNIQRRVTYTIQVSAQVNAPAGYQLSLVSVSGTSVSFAEMNGDFSLGSSCTNCAGSGSTAAIINGATVTRQGDISVDNPGLTTGCGPGGCVSVGSLSPSALQSSLTAYNPGLILQTSPVTTTSGTTGTGGSTTDSKGTTKVNTMVAESKGTNVNKAGTGVAPGRPGSPGGGVALSFIDPTCDLAAGSSSCGLPTANYYYTQIMGQAVMVNPRVFGLILIAIIIGLGVCGEIGRKH